MCVARTIRRRPRCRGCRRLVPGHVHLDLMAAGVIADPFKNFAERGAQWVDETDWVYETTFDVAEPHCAPYAAAL